LNNAIIEWLTANGYEHKNGPSDESLLINCGKGSHVGIVISINSGHITVISHRYISLDLGSPNFFVDLKEIIDKRIQFITSCKKS